MKKKDSVKNIYKIRENSPSETHATAVHPNWKPKRKKLEN